MAIRWLIPRLPRLVAIRWLIPRLPRLHAATPGLTAHLDTSFREWAFNLARADVSIIHARRPNRDDLAYDRLFRCSVRPI